MLHARAISCLYCLLIVHQNQIDTKKTSPITRPGYE